MQSLLAAVGFASSPTQASSDGLPPSAERGALAEVRDLLPDFIAIATATEPGMLELHEEASSLDTASLSHTIFLLRGWCQTLRKRPRVDESLASFRAQFLRSNALEASLDALRRNAALCRALHGALAVSDAIDATLASPWDRSSPAGGPARHWAEDGPQAALAEICNMLHLCLPKTVVPLVRPALCAVLSNTPDECAAAGVMAISKLKEDWTEVVRSQAIRGLERRLDSVTYELQKTPASASNNEGGTRDDIRRRASYDQVVVLIALCEALAAAADQAVERSRKGSAALDELGASLEDWMPVGKTRLQEVKMSVVSKKEISDCVTEPLDCGDSASDAAEAICSANCSESSSEPQDGLDANVEHQSAAIQTSTPSISPGWIGRDESAAIPSPGKWKLVFNDAENAKAEEGPTLLARRAAAVAERSALLVRLQELDVEISSLDEQLAQTRGPLPSASGSTRAPSFCSSEKVSASDVSESAAISCKSSSSQEGDVQQVAIARAASTVPSAPVTPESLLPSSAQLVAQEISEQLPSVSSALSGELQRHLERHRCQLQQRRSQLLQGLAAHLDSEATYVGCIAADCHAEASAPARGCGLGAGAVEATRRRVQELCRRAESALAGARVLPEMLEPGARCRARWMDGNYYDAEVQCTMDDGTVLLNWLRPRPVLDSTGGAMSSEAVPAPLVTVSERGGDDTLHRIVPREDVKLVGTGSVADPPKNVRAARQLFESRSSEDHACFDCRQDGADWASVSFGIYICASCASEHQGLRLGASLVRPLDEGWGWSALDLLSLRCGGNAAFRAQLQKYPALERAPAHERYTSRLAEHYRRHLDARCVDIPPPQPPSREAAAQQSTSDFVTASEAVAAAHTAGQRFLTTAVAAQAQLPARARAATHRQGIAARTAGAAATQRRGLWGEGL